MSGMAASWGWCVDVRGGNATERARIKDRKTRVDLQKFRGNPETPQVRFQGKAPGGQEIAMRATE